MMMMMMRMMMRIDTRRRNGTVNMFSTESVDRCKYVTLCISSFGFGCTIPRKL
jgi:hypothetical protein